MRDGLADHWAEMLGPEVGQVNQRKGLGKQYPFYGVHSSESIFRSTGRWRMSTTNVAREARRSTRVQLKVVIEAKGVTEPIICDGETIVVNLHGALISTDVPLRVGMKIQVHVIQTNTRAAADVVHLDPDRDRFCGIELGIPENIWGVCLPPDDWHEGGA